MAHFAGLVAAGHPSEPDAALRLRHLDDAQDARRAARGLRPLQGGARAGARQGGLPGNAGRPAPARDRRQGDLLQDRRLGRLPRLPVADPRQRRRARRDADGERARRPHRRNRHAPPADGPARRRVVGQGGRGAAARGEDHRQPEHRSLRRAPADGGLGRPSRHARGDHARLRRGRPARGGGDHRRRARRATPDIDALRGRSDALCEKRPLYPGFRGYTTYQA